jgi:formamidopyrimidine-DNA glycosylase
MPELPEVETMRRGIAHVVGRRIRAVTFPRETRRPIAVRPGPNAVAKHLRGRRIAAVGRFGKRVAIELEPRGAAPRQWLLIEPRMTGLMLVAPPPTTTHVRLVIQLDPPGSSESLEPPGSSESPSVRRLTFWDRRGLGTVTLVDARGLDNVCGAARLGPDGLAITGVELDSRLGRSRRAVKVALLDQRAVAGIGNIYAAEILFHARIDPRASCHRLGPDDWERIAATARRLLATAVRLEGSTIGDATYKTADNRSGRFQRRHRVYGRAGQPCRRCGGTVQRVVQAQRSTFFCPDCQWHPRKRSRRLS